MATLPLYPFSLRQAQLVQKYELSTISQNVTAEGKFDLNAARILQESLLFRLVNGEQSSLLSRQLDENDDDKWICRLFGAYSK